MVYWLLPQNVPQLFLFCQNMKQSANTRQHQLFWGRVVMRKLLNIPTKDTDYSADTDSGSDDSDDDFRDIPARETRFKDDKFNEEAQDEENEAVPRLRRRNSETFRAQYINTKEIKIFAGTWNVGGIVPSDDIELDGWLDRSEPADIYVLGFQEIIPLNAGNIFGAEDIRPVSKWETIIRETLDNFTLMTNKFKCYSDPPSPSKFKQSEDVQDVVDELAVEFDSDDGEEEVYPWDEETKSFDDVDLSLSDNKTKVEPKLQRQFSSRKRLDRLTCFREEETLESEEEQSNNVPLFNRKLARTISGTEKLGFCWPEPQRNFIPQHVLERHNSIKSLKSFKETKSFKRYTSFNGDHNKGLSDAALLAELDIESLIKRKRRSPYVRIISKQMVGLVLTIWVRRNLRRHVHNMSVSTVGVGAMGYIGNKGSISVSLSVYQTLFCFVCTHLTAGEKEADALKRNADVQEILRRTHFNSHSSFGLPKRLHDHERIFWLGDLNYRLNLSYEKTKELIARKDWSKLSDSDQLIREFRKGRTFDGWSEGILNFAPTYKYEVNSHKYIGEDPKSGRRTPAWCDRVLSFGKGIQLLSYKRNELRISDHRPVSALYNVEVEVFSTKKLQKALTFTDAEIDEEPIISDMGIATGINRFNTGEVSYTGINRVLRLILKPFECHSKLLAISWQGGYGA